MNGTEAKKTMISYGAPSLEELGYFHKKTRDTEAVFIKKNESGFEDIGISTLNYSPEVVLRFGMGKRLEVVENILKQLSAVVDVKESLLKKDATTFNILDKKGLYLALEGTETEEGVKQSMDMIIDYMTSYAIPLFDQFEDLRELDKTINGTGEMHWVSDSPHKPFNLAHSFGDRRMIIARLSKKDVEFELFLKRLYQQFYAFDLENNIEDKFDKNNMNERTNKIIHFLCENIKCIY